jgi:Cu2+-exporting ATPase
MHEKNHHEGHNHDAMINDFKKRFLISLFLTLPVLFLSPIVRHFLHLEVLTFSGDIYVLFILSSIIFFYGGWPFLKGLVEELIKRQPGMMTLIAVAITTAYVYSSLVVFGLSGMMFFWELATLIDIMLLGHWIEMKSILGAGEALEKLAKLMPATAHILMPNGIIKDIPLKNLMLGDRVLVKPGEKIPADGIVLDGETSVNESMLTGESKPVIKKIDSNVIGGSINGEGSITVEVKKTGKDSFLSQVIHLVKEAQESKSKTQDLANRAANWLTFIALGGGALTLLIWVAFTNQTLAFALERTVTVMIITCPHALGLAVPLVVAVSTAIAASNGLLIRNRAAFEKARNINAIIFDKTGTLTQGKFGITDVLVFDADLNNETLIDYAAAVESHSEHPIAKGIMDARKNRLEVQQFIAIPGK